MVQVEDPFDVEKTFSSILASMAHSGDSVLGVATFKSMNREGETQNYCTHRELDHMRHEKVRRGASGVPW